MLSVNKENRKSWEFINKSNSKIVVGDLPKCPSILPGKKCNFLRYYSEEQCSQSNILLSLAKSGVLQLTKVKDGVLTVIVDADAEAEVVSIGATMHDVEHLYDYIAEKNAIQDDKIGKLQRVSTGVYGTAVADVEYYSSEQHGGIYGGTVYRKYFAIPDGEGVGATENIAHGLTDFTLVSFNGSGVIKLQNDTQWSILPHVDFGGGTRQIEININQTNIDIVGGAGVDWRAGGFIYLDYTKT